MMDGQVPHNKWSTAVGGSTKGFRCNSNSRSPPVCVYVCVTFQSFKIILTNAMLFKQNYAKQILQSIFHKLNYAKQITWVKLQKANETKKMKESKFQEQITENKMQKGKFNK